MKVSAWAKTAIAVGLVLLIVLVGAPYLIKHLVRQWLLENGGDRVQVEDVDFNPFIATLIFEGVDIKVDEETTLSFAGAAVDLNWRPLFRKQIEVESVQLNGFEMLIDNRDPEFISLGGVRLAKNAGEAAEQAPVEEAVWLSGIRTLTLADFHIVFQDTQLRLDVDLNNLRLSDLTQWSPDTATPVSFDGIVNGAEVRFEGSVAPLAATPRYQADLSIKKLPLNDFEQLARPHLDALSGLLSFDGSLALEQQAESIKVDQEGTLSVELLGATVRQPAIDIENRRLSLSGKGAVSAAQTAVSIEMASSASLDELRIASADRKINLVDAGRLVIDDLRVQGVDAISVALLSLEQLELQRSAEATEDESAMQQGFLRVEKVELERLSFADRLVSADRLSFQQLHNRVVLDENGELNLVRFIDLVQNLNETAEPAADSESETTGSGTGPRQARVDQPDATEPATDPGQEDAEQRQAAGSASGSEQADDAQPVDLAIGRIEASPGSALSFSDLSVEPPFAVTLALEEVSLEQLDTRQPQQKSPLRLKGRIDKHAELSLQGDVQPFAQPPDLDASASIRALDLPPLSSYTRGSLGLVLDSGTLDADIQLASKNETLDGKVSLKLHQLTLKNLESENSLQKSLPVPLDVALDTLRDKNNLIELDIPIEGNISDPKFDPSDAIRQAVAKGVKKGALTYLKFALQPYGTLITAAQYAGEAINRVRLAPVGFEAGQSTLGADDTDYLSKVAGVMQERPKLAVKVCGVAVEQDKLYYQEQQRREAAARKADKKQTVEPTKEAAGQPAPVDRQKLVQLAEQRAAAVKDHLIARHGITASRLVACQPRVEPAESKEEPRTDLLI
jgi:hypothetical protein